MLANYAEVITKTSAKHAQMVMALLYCKDRDLRLDDIDVVILVRALEGIDDTQIDFFLKCVGNETAMPEGSPYPLASINERNLSHYDVHQWGAAGINIYVNDLIQRRLLLPDPMVGAYASAGDGGWAVWFGVSAKSKKYAHAFQKAQALIDGINETGSGHKTSI